MRQNQIADTATKNLIPQCKCKSLQREGRVIPVSPVDSHTLMVISRCELYSKAQKT